MKQISTQDIEHLRKRMIDRHNLLLENYQMLSQVVRADHRQMIQRLENANKQMDQLLALPEALTGQDPRVQALYLELNELRAYFGAPTGRPLEDRGVDFVPLYIQSLRLLFQINSSMTLYKEMIRTDLALLEYLIKHQQDVSPCLLSLTDSISLCRYRKQFTDIQDSLIFDLGHYLLLVCQELTPLFHGQKDAALLNLISLAYLEIAMAFAQFNCAPEKIDEDFCNDFIMAIVVQVFQKTPNKYVAHHCCSAALWLWKYPLSPTQKDQLAYCFRKAQEVLKNA